MEETPVITAFIIYFSTFFTLFIVYLAYAQNRKIPTHLNLYYIDGKFTVDTVMDLICRIETAYGLTFNRVKNQIARYHYVSRGKLSKYEHRINRQLFCLMMNGRPRLEVFKELVDPFIMFIFSAQIGCAFLLVIFSILYSGKIAFVICIPVLFILMVFYFKSLVLFLEFALMLRRSVGKSTAGLYVSIIALNSILRGDVKRIYHEKTGRYYYQEDVSYALYDVDDSSISD